MGREGKAGCVSLEGGVGVIMSVHPKGCAFYLFLKNCHESHLYRPNQVRGMIAEGLIKFILKFF